MLTHILANKTEKKTGGEKIKLRESPSSERGKLLDTYFRKLKLKLKSTFKRATNATSKSTSKRATSATSKSTSKRATNATSKSTS